MLENKLLGDHGDLLRLRSQKAEVIAKNLANSNSPGYKAVDFSVETALGSKGKFDNYMKSTNSNHIGFDDGKQMAVDMKFRPSTQQSLDGNTVESDQEIIRLTDNNIRYQYSLSYASKKLETIKSILKDI